MWNALIRWSLGNRAAVLGLAALLLGWGAYTATRLPVDVLPDVNAPTVTVLTETHGMAPDEVESVYQEHCAVCHGANLEGAAQGPALVGAPLGKQ